MKPNDWQTRFLNVMANMTDDETVMIARETIKSHGMDKTEFLITFLMACRNIGQAKKHGN